MCKGFLVLVGVVLVAGVPVDHQPNGEELQYILRNISALWEEMNDIRHEVDYHLHHGQSDSRHNLAQVLQEVQILQHEHHVHRLHHPHEGHTHKSTLYKHLEEFHGLGHAHEQQELTHSNHSGQADHHDHGAPNHDHSHQNDNGHHDSHGHGAVDFHDFHGLRAHAQKHDLSDAHLYESDHYAQDAQESRDPWIHATCQMEPNVDLPESNVRGLVHLSKRRDDWGSVFFDIDVSGFDPTKSGHLHSFHVHEHPFTGQHCNDAGGFLKPGPASRYIPREHLGNLGDLQLNSEWKFDHALVASLDVDFHGEKNIIGYPLVIHDVGFGDPSSSLYKGRLACCNIHMKPELHDHTSGN